MPHRKSSNAVSEDTKTIVTTLVLLFAYPAGLILMWVWPAWSKWVKWVITLPVVLIVVGIFAAIVLVAINPTSKLQTAQKTYCAKECAKNPGETSCFEACVRQYISPTSTP